MPTEQKKSNTPKHEKDSFHHSNDKAFKKIFQVKETALEYLEAFIPHIKVHLDLSVFELDNTNHVSKDFEEHFSDVVYRTALKKKPTDKRTRSAAVVLLFEHKKSVNSYFLLYLQLLEYIIFIWRQDVTNKKMPSVIIPIVVYQGKRGLKTKRLHDCFKGVPKELLKYIIDFEFHLTSVQPLPDDKVLGLNEKGLLRSLFLAYRFVENRDHFTNAATEIFKFYKNSEQKFEFFQLLFGFITSDGYLSPHEIKTLLDSYLLEKQKEYIMTTVQVWKQEGKIEGKIEKAHFTILRGKWNGLSAEILANISELPLVDVQKLFDGFDSVFKCWQDKKERSLVKVEVPYLTDEEIKCLYDLFDEK